MRAGSQGGLLVAVGTHQPAVELLLLRPAGADGRSAAALQPLTRLALGPAAALPPPAGGHAERRRAVLVAALGLENGSGGGSGGGSQGLPRRHRGYIPESVQCLAPAGGEGQVEVGACVKRSSWQSVRFVTSDSAPLLPAGHTEYSASAARGITEQSPRGITSTSSPRLRAPQLVHCVHELV